jgi:two-component system sensor histidine kinase RegB
MTPFYFHDSEINTPHHGENSEFGSHLVGMWASFIFSAVLLSVFLQAMNRTLQKKEQEINQQKEALSRNEQIVALGTLAADAAHELSTPLSTMAITIKELQYQCDGQSEICDDLALLRTQVDRCKSVLTSMTERTGFSRPDSLEPTSLVGFIEQQLHEIQLTHPSREVQYSSQLDNDLIMQNKPAFLHSLKNIIGNALEASEHHISINLDLDGENLILQVANDGCDITHLNEKKIGTPFYTGKEHGLGLGLFLAISSIEQLGGGVEWHSRPGGGTIIQLRVPLDGLQAPSITEKKQ